MVARPAPSTAAADHQLRAATWVTWSEAAVIAGCPETTIEHYARTGRIQRRTGRTPSLSGASVERFAAWWHDETARRRQRAEARARKVARSAPAGPPEPDGWVDTATAARMLGCSESHLPWLARNGRFEGRKVGGKWWYLAEGVRAHIDERNAWISEVGAAQLVGCDPRTIQKAVKNGTIEQRRVHRTQPSLALHSVLQFAEHRWAKTHQEQLERRRRETERRRLQGPPLDGNAWLTTAAAAALLGVGQTQVRRLAEQNWFTTVKTGRRRWYRHDEVASIARALNASRPSA
jgi:hypothetical protein